MIPHNKIEKPMAVKLRRIIEKPDPPAKKYKIEFRFVISAKFLPRIYFCHFLAAHSGFLIIPFKNLIKFLGSRGSYDF